MRNVTNYWAPDERYYIQTIITGSPKNSKEMHYGVLKSDNGFSWFVKDAEELKNTYKTCWSKETPEGIDRTRMYGGNTDYDGNMDYHEYMSEGIILDIDYNAMEKDLRSTPFGSEHFSYTVCINIIHALENIYDKISFLKGFDIYDRSLFDNAITSIVCDVCPIIAFNSSLCDMYDVSDRFNMFNIKPLKELSNNGELFTFGINNTDHDGHIVIYIMNNEEVFDDD
jgi:hypothetical protein